MDHDTSPGGNGAAASGERSRPPARVVVIDDHRIVADSLAMAIDAQPDLECVGTAATVAEARRLVATVDPDLVLTDVGLPDGDGIVEAAHLHRERPEIRILVMASHTDAEVLARAASAGVCGFLPKESGVSEVIRALRAARDGGMTIDAATLSAVLGRLRASKPAVAVVSPLTPREEEVLRAMGAGHDPQKIARRLGMSLHTCRGHVKSILAKLEAHSQLEAVVIAHRRGLLRELLAR